MSSSAADRPSTPVPSAPGSDVRRLYQARVSHRQALLSLALTTARYAEFNDREFRRQLALRGFGA